MGEVVKIDQVGALAYYERARVAIAEARQADELSQIIGLSECVRAAARMAKDKQMEIDAAEIRIRATRRLGEMLIEHKATVGMNPGHRGDTNSELPTLDEMGIDPKLSAGSQRLAILDPNYFEERIDNWRRAAQDGGRVTVSLYQDDDAPPAPHRPRHADIPAPATPNAPARSYSELVGLMIQRRHALNLSQMDLDLQIGWPQGMTSKLEIPHMAEGRTAGPRTLTEWLHGLGVGLQLVAI